jgi:hypothetical protein
VTEPLTIFLCDGAAAYNLASRIEHAAREAGLDANAEGVFHTSGTKVEPAVFVSKNDVNRRPDANHQREPDRQRRQQQQQQQGWTDTWQVIVARSVAIAAFAALPRIALTYSLKQKVFRPPKASRQPSTAAKSKSTPATKFAISSGVTTRARRVQRAG